MTQFQDMKTDGIKARPVGRVVRLLLGVLLVAEGGRHLIGTSLGLVAATAGVVIGEFVFYAALHLAVFLLVPSVNRWVGALVAVTPVALVFVLGGTPGTLGSLLFVGVSLLLTAVRNDAGCEVMTLPGMVFGQRTHLVCVVMSPIDWVEEKISG